jgi:hypothetical protein
LTTSLLARQYEVALEPGGDAMKYPIQNEGMRFWAGKNAQGEQFLFGPSLPNIELFRFDRQGRFLGKEVREMSHLPSWNAKARVYNTGAGFISLMEKEIEAIRQELGIELGTVTVEEFEDEESAVAILAFPSEYEEYRENRDEYSAADRKAFDSYIEEWIKKGRFVFVWGEEHWMTKDGEML